MSIEVSGGKRGLTDPEIAAVILAAIPDQPLETQRKIIISLRHAAAG